jgi:hypothetical protein
LGSFFSSLYWEITLLQATLTTLFMVLTSKAFTFSAVCFLSATTSNRKLSVLNQAISGLPM